MNFSRRMAVLGSALTLAGAALATGGTSAYGVTRSAADPAAVPAIAASNIAAFVSSRPAILHASASETFVGTGVATAAGSATQYAAFERTYAGVPVIGGDFVVVTDATGQVTYTSVAMTRPIGTLSVAPRLNAAAAQAVATSQLHSVSRVEGTRLVVYALGATPRLAWESTVAGIGSNGISRLTVTVDATNGKVLDTLEHVAHGTGTAKWNGPNPVTLATTHSGSTFTMRDPVVTNLSCQNASGNVVFSGSDDVWGNGVGTNRETGCVDALFGAQTEVKMLSQWLGRNAMNGTGGAWPIRVGLNQLNAFYDGTQVQIGHNSAGAWIGALDVIAHEMGHGVDDHTPGGISRSGTQEFIADTFGASTEWFANEPSPFDTRDFLVGDKINLSGSGPIRNMANPSLLGDPNCYSSSIPSTEVHAAAGPGNHWFYLLAMGTSPGGGFPNSPTCNGSTIVGLGTQTAMRILYNAMLMKTTSSSYLRYRVWTLQAAKNLTPGNCTNYTRVKAAWNAVSVPAQSGEATCP